jgi:uncharacterized membrane protein
MRFITILTILLLVTAALGHTQGNTTGTPEQDNALKVLTEKCNVCHRRQNPGKVFTPGNMNDLAPAIYKQVFIRKRMPRGNTIKLSEADRKALMDWIKTQTITDNAP